MFLHRYYCRSVQYDEMNRQCILSDEDSMSQREQLRSTGGHLPPPPGAAPSHRPPGQFDQMRQKSSQFLFDLVCLDSRKCMNTSVKNTTSQKNP